MTTKAQRKAIIDEKVSAEKGQMYGKSCKM